MAAEDNKQIFIFVEKSELPIRPPTTAAPIPGDRDEIFYGLIVKTDAKLSQFNALRHKTGLPIALLSLATGFSFD